MVKSRWFRFSLRTMFVLVTVVSVWLGWQVKWIRDRREFLKGEAVIFVAHDMSYQRDGSCAPPWPLGLFGEVGQSEFRLFINSLDHNHLTAEDLAAAEKARRLFPECDILIPIHRPTKGK